MSRRLRNVLLVCVLSNGAVGVAGAAFVGQSVDAPVALDANAGPKNTTATHPETSTTTAPDTTTVAAQAITATTGQAHTAARRAPAAAAADDVTGIASSAAPPSVTRVAPDLGDYPVAITGSASVNGKAQSVPSVASMVLSAAGGNVRQTTPKAPGSVVLVQRFLGDESDLVSLELSASDVHKQFVPSSPVTYLRYNAPSGSTWTWSATSTDGKTHVSASGTVGGTKNMDVGGVTVSVVEVTTSLAISGDVNGSAQLVTWASPTYRLPVVQRQHIDASAKAFLGLSVRLLTDTTTTLRSLTPA